MLKFRSPRMAGCALAAFILLTLVVILSPQQGPVALYKLALVLVSAFCGYWIDRTGFPYARPDSYLCFDWRVVAAGKLNLADNPVADGHAIPFAAALLRRAVIMGCCMLAVCLGL